MFPVNSFSFLAPELISSPQMGDKRYNRARSMGTKEPYFEIAATTSPLRYDGEGAEVDAYLDHLMGAFTIFTIPNPVPSRASHVALQLDANATKGAKTITIKNLPALTTDATKAGDFIRIAGHTKVYRLVYNNDSDASGKSTVTVTPPLIQNYNENDAVFYGDDVEFQVCLDKRNSSGIKAKDGNYVVHDITLIEQA